MYSYCNTLLALGYVHSFCYRCDTFFTTIAKIGGNNGAKYVKRIEGIYLFIVFFLGTAVHSLLLNFKIFVKNATLTFQTSVFTPAHGTVTSVRVTSLVPTPEVIKSLLDKFKVHF